MTTVANHWHNHLLVRSVVRKHFLEPVGQIEELISVADFGLKNLWFHDSFVHILDAGGALCILEA